MPVTGISMAFTAVNYNVPVFMLLSATADSFDNKPATVRFDVVCVATSFTDVDTDVEHDATSSTANNGEVMLELCIYKYV